MDRCELTCDMQSRCEQRAAVTVVAMKDWSPSTIQRAAVALLHAMMAAMQVLDDCPTVLQTPALCALHEPLNGFWRFCCSLQSSDEMLTFFFSLNISRRQSTSPGSVQNRQLKRPTPLGPS